MTTLHAWRRNANVSFPGVLLEVQSLIGEDRSAIALLSHPEWFRLGRLIRADIVGPTRESMDTMGVFEARVFTEDWELRWLQQGASGAAVLLTEAEACRPAGNWEAKGGLVDVSKLRQRYLVLGPLAPHGGPQVSDVPGNANRTPDATAAEWSATQTSRVETIAIPVDPSAGGAVLRTTEYIGRDVNGNAFVAEERLVTLEPYRWPT